MCPALAVVKRLLRMSLVFFIRNPIKLGMISKQARNIFHPTELNYLDRRWISYGIIFKNLLLQRDYTAQYSRRLSSSQNNFEFNVYIALERQKYT
jgi:hypothetical protein